MPIGVAEFMENQENRCPVVLVLDTSGSMQGVPIKALNDGIKTFQNDVMRDTQAMLSVETAIVTFGNGGVKVAQDFVGIDQFVPPNLEAGDLTPMGEAIQVALDLVEDRKVVYKSHGIQYYRPWVFLITDGTQRINGLMRPNGCNRQKQKTVYYFSPSAYRGRIWKS